MAYIRPLPQKDGSTKYRAEIVIKNHGQIIARDSKTFLKKKLAADWGKRREVELQEQSVYKKRDRLTVGEVIERYNKDYPSSGRTKNFDLNKLLTYDIAKRDVYALTPTVLIDHVRWRNETVAPQTAANDLVWLNSVISTMTGALSLDLDLSIFDTARKVLRKEGLIGKSVERDRRPTPEELWKLSRYFYDTNRIMLYIMWFAVYSSRRQSEITRICWDDLNETKRTVIIRDLKDPRIKNLQRKAKVPRSAWKIIEKQPKISARIFPMNSKTVGTYFTNACKLLDIQDLRFHDLRHDAVSRLFERGLSIVDVQHVSLHKNWTTLKRYCNIDPGDLDI